MKKNFRKLHSDKIIIIVKLYPFFNNSQYKKFRAEVWEKTPVRWFFYLCSAAIDSGTQLLRDFWDALGNGLTWLT